MAIPILLVLIFSELIFLGNVQEPTPSRSQITAGCVRHHGVASVSNGGNFNDPVIVCKDGKVWFSDQ